MSFYELDMAKIEAIARNAKRQGKVQFEAWKTVRKFKGQTLLTLIADVDKTNLQIA